MSSDDRQHQMDFILKQQAVFSSDMIELKDRLNQMGDQINGLKDVQRQQAESIASLATVVQRQQAESIASLVVIVQQLAEVVEINRQETQGAINGLIVANEATRDLANRAAQLAIGVSQRLTSHEQEPHE